MEQRAGRDEDEPEQTEARNDLRVQLDEPRPFTSLRLGGMDFPMVPALALESVNAQAPASLDIDLGGVVGAGLLEAFRVTFTDEGRFAWVEPDPTMVDERKEK